MSYSFTLKAPSKALALAGIRAKLDEVVAQQPVHVADRAQAEQAAALFVSLLPDDDSRDVAVSMNGYVTGTWNGTALMAMSGVAVGVSASLVPRQPQA